VEVSSSSCHSARHGRDGSASGNGGDEPRSAFLCVTAEAAEGEGKDGCEACLM
jgi:hypothetical protein